MAGAVYPTVMMDAPWAPHALKPNVIQRVRHTTHAGPGESVVQEARCPHFVWTLGLMKPNAHAPVLLNVRVVYVWMDCARRPATHATNPIDVFSSGMITGAYAPVRHPQARSVMPTANVQGVCASELDAAHDAKVPMTVRLERAVLRASAGCAALVAADRIWMHVQKTESALLSQQNAVCVPVRPKTRHWVRPA